MPLLIPKVTNEVFAAVDYIYELLNFYKHFMTLSAF